MFSGKLCDNNMMRKDYIAKLIVNMTAKGLDAVMVSPGEELRFLTGVCPMQCERFQGFFIKADGGMFYFCNLLYVDELRAGLPDDVAIYSWFDGEVMTEVAAGVLGEQGLLGKRIGVNSTAQAFNILELMDKMDVTFVNAKPLLEEIRMIKSPEEMENLRKSAAIADQVFSEVQSIIKPGITEGEIAEFLLNRMTELGGEDAECIVAAGANAAYPHYQGSTAVVREGEAVLMDYGCTYHGMYSDMTRTVYVGSIDDRQREAYELVKRSNEEAEAMVREGAFVPDIDRKSREVLAEKGYAETLINRLGHGIGYTIHEAPDIKQSNPIKLARGMAFSIEPGIYIGGDFGIRIEDIVMINEKGEREILNKSPKDLIIL